MRNPFKRKVRINWPVILESESKTDPEYLLLVNLYIEKEIMVLFSLN